MAELTKQDLTDGLAHLATKQDLTYGLATTRQGLTHSLTESLTASFRIELATDRQDIIHDVSDQLSVVVDAMATNEELRHQGIIIEQMQDKLDVALEATSNDITVSETLKTHTVRLAKLETESSLIKDTVKSHSKLLR